MAGRGDELLEVDTVMRFAVFAGERYYPLGGWQDFKGCHLTLEMALAAAHVEVAKWRSVDQPWVHVVDLLVGEVVATSE